MRDEQDDDVSGGDVLGDGVLGNDGLRLVDVLLEEHFAGAAPVQLGPRALPAAPVQRRSAPWLAAALLGITALAGTWWLRHEPAVPAQDPAPRATTPFEPKDDAELQAFLKQVVVVEARTAISFGRPGLEVLRPSGVRVRIATPHRVRAMCAGWEHQGPAANNAPDVMAADVWLTAGDGRQLHCIAGGGAGGTCYLGGQCWHTPGVYGKGLMNDSQEETAATVEALRGLPPSRGNLDCTALGSADLQAELPRFDNLTRLVVTLDDRVAAVVAACPTIEELGLVVPRRAAGITAAGWKRIAGLPHLHRLRITGDVAFLDPSHLQLLRTLRELEIPEDRALRSRAGLRHLAAITQLPALVELRIAVPWTAKLAPDASRALAAMPTLRRLALCTDEPPQPLLLLLKDAHIEKLHLADFELDAPCLEALAAATHLRELDLRFARFANEAEGLLPGLQQLTRLDLRGALLTAPQLADLKGWLMTCELLASPGTVGSGPALEGPSSWTEDR